MANADRTYDLKVSDYFFRLTAEGIRLFSTSINRHCSLSDVINVRAHRANNLVECYEVDDLKAHLRIIPADGDIELHITILETSAHSIEAAIPALEEGLGKGIRFIEALSLVLFDLVVERNATEVLTKLGLSLQEAGQYRMSLKRRVSNVVPFR